MQLSAPSPASCSIKKMELHDFESSILSAFLSMSVSRYDASAVRTHPLISVVIPSFNQVQFIERTLLSLLNQNYPSLEIVVVDGGSSDGTTELLESYRDQLAYVFSGPDNGQSDALNHGFSKVSGEILCWLNSDDLQLPGSLHAVAEAFHAFPEASVVFGDWWSIDSQDRVTEVHYAFDFSLRHFIYEGFTLNSQAMFWRRDVHRRFGEFDVKLHRTMDYDLIVRLGLNEGPHKFVRLEKALACFRRHPEQKTTNAGGDIVESEHRWIAEKNGFSRKYRAAGRFLRLAYRARRAWWYLKRGGIGFTWAQLVKPS